MDKNLKKELNKYMVGMAKHHSETDEEFKDRVANRARQVMDEYEVKKLKKKKKRKNWWIAGLVVLVIALGLKPMQERMEEVKRERAEMVIKREKERVERLERLERQRVERAKKAERDRLERLRRDREKTLNEVDRLTIELELLKNYSHPFVNVEDLEGRINALGNDLDAWLDFYAEVTHVEMLGLKRGDRSKWKVTFDRDRPLPESILGRSYSQYWVDDNGNKMGRANGVDIGINESKWYTLTSHQKMWVLFHELGHAIYEWEHDESKYIMKAGIRLSPYYNRANSLMGLQQYYAEINRLYVLKVKRDKIEKLAELRRKL